MWSSLSSTPTSEGGCWPARGPRPTVPPLPPDRPRAGLTCPAVHTLLLQLREEGQEGVQQVLGHHAGELVLVHVGLPGGADSASPGLGAPLALSPRARPSTPRGKRPCAQGSEQGEAGPGRARGRPRLPQGPAKWPKLGGGRARNPVRAPLTASTAPPPPQPPEPGGGRGPREWAAHSEEVVKALGVPAELGQVVHEAVALLIGEQVHQVAGVHAYEGNCGSGRHPELRGSPGVGAGWRWGAAGQGPLRAPLPTSRYPGAWGGPALLGDLGGGLGSTHRGDGCSVPLRGGAG